MVAAGTGAAAAGYPLLRGLALEPAISGGDRGAAEHDGKDDHDDGFETHGDLAILIGAGRESATEIGMRVGTASEDAGGPAS